MNIFKIPQTTILIFSWILGAHVTCAQARIEAKDFDILDNTSWEGTLTYLNYQSDELSTIGTTMQISTYGDIIEQSIQYTWEPSKNVVAKTKIKKKGRFLGQQKVVSKTIKEDGTTLLKTIANGKDNNRKATLFFTYEFNDDRFHVKKEVRYKGKDALFMRNKYNYTKIKK